MKRLLVVFLTLSCAPAYADGYRDLYKLFDTSGGVNFTKKGDVSIAPSERGAWNFSVGDQKSEYSRDDEGKSTREKQKIFVFKNNGEVSRISQFQMKGGSKGYWQADNFKTVQLSAGKVSSFTNCESHSEFAQSDWLAWKSVVFAKANKERDKIDILMNCYTVSHDLCESIAKKFKTDSVKNLRGKEKECRDFVTDFVKATETNNNNEYYEFEDKGAADINAIMQLYDAEHIKTGKEKVEWRQFQSYAARGGRSNPLYEYRTIGKIIDLCQSVEFTEGKNVPFPEKEKPGDGSENDGKSAR